ncbi:MAG: hypothetical protein KZQ83_01295 [gamma proteobacterium symbiont of Taylorina sp.]|nr:hypothetical protein [gamma proteobacterium symbiont of Taylorina sp.]
MQVQNTQDQTVHSMQVNETGHSANTSKTAEFSNIYKDQVLNNKNPIRQKIDKTAEKNLNTIILGTLNKKNTTVAHLLLDNPELKSKTWSIIHNSVNTNKVFNQIPTGSQVYYNKNSGEVSWRQESWKHESLRQGQPPLTRSSSSLSESPVQTLRSDISANNDNKVLLGTLNKQTSTVSELLANNNNFNAQRWNIIHSDINKNKAFTKIPDGAAIYIDSQSKELSWSNSNKRQSISDTTTIMANKLDDAVKPFMGTAYKNIDCYTLVVNGLENMGINYRGKDSLSRQLLQMARSEGRADNAYFTGEGITQAIGNKVYSKALTQTGNIVQQSQDIFREIKELMKKGDILSFSTQSKGHTGIISHSQDQWTFINSGRLDHSINKNAPKNGVGEETLLDEINNWIKLAQERSEYLQITIGRLDNQKLA